MLIYFSDNNSDNGEKYVNWVPIHSSFICEQDINLATVHE
jgi:hypothetical protein